MRRVKPAFCAFRVVPLHPVPQSLAIHTALLRHCGRERPFKTSAIANSSRCQYLEIRSFLTRGGCVCGRPVARLTALGE